METSVSRRAFLGRLSVLCGIGLGGVALAACGDEPTATSAPAPTAAKATTAPAVPVIAATPAATKAGDENDNPPTADVSAALAGKKDSAGPDGYLSFGDAARFSNLKNPQLIKVGEKIGYISYADKLYTFSNICTHKGCSVRFDAGDNEFECPCHGSKYTASGEVKRGPAKDRLPLFDTKTVNGTLYVKAS